MTEKAPYFPWADRFIEIALKTLIELNTEYSIMRIGHVNKMTGCSNKTIEENGFEILDEKVVCFKIIQNAMQSYLFSGSFQKKIDPNVEAGIRYWYFERERRYHNEDSANFCDIVLDRVNILNGELNNKFNEPVYIEAKRATITALKDLNSGETKNISPRNYLKCVHDIKKILKERDYVIEKGIYSNLFGHLLIWGATCDRDGCNPVKCKNDLDLELKKCEEYKGTKLQIHQVRWFPLDLLNDDTLPSDYKVKKWGWVTLIQIIPNE